MFIMSCLLFFVIMSFVVMVVTIMFVFMFVFVSGMSVFVSCMDICRCMYVILLLGILIMETIRQNGKTILYSNDGISIKMVFKNLTGRNFQGQEYTDYIRHIAIGSMGFSPGIIEHCRDGEVAGKGTIPNV